MEQHNFAETIEGDVFGGVSDGRYRQVYIAEVRTFASECSDLHSMKTAAGSVSTRRYVR